MPDDHLSAIMGAIGKLQGSMDTMVVAQAKLFELTDGFQGRVATLESQQQDVARRLFSAETTQEKHTNELAEGRGASRANRWLVLVIPPAIVAAVEVAKAYWGHGK